MGPRVPDVIGRSEFVAFSLLVFVDIRFAPAPSVFAVVLAFTPTEDEAMVETEGASPFVEPELRLLRLSCRDLPANRPHKARQLACYCRDRFVPWFATSC